MHGICAEVDAHFAAHKATCDAFLEGIERDIAFINWAEAQKIMDEAAYCQAQSDEIAIRRAEAQMAVVTAFMDPDQSTYEYLFGTQMIPDGQGGFIVDKYSGALNGMLDGVELNGADWSSWRASLIAEFENGTRPGAVDFDPSWTDEITPAPFCVDPELSSILQNMYGLDADIKKADAFLSL